MKKWAFAFAAGAVAFGLGLPVTGDNASASGTYVGQATVASVDESPSSSGWYQVDSVDLTLTASDSVDGVMSIAYKDDSADPGYCFPPPSGTGSTSPYPATRSVTVQVSGPHDCYIEYWAVDGLGNQESHQYIDFKIDDRAPHISVLTGTVSGQSGWADKPIWIGSITCDDNYLALAGYPPQSGCSGAPFYSLDGSPAQAFTGGFYVNEGRNTLNTTAADIAGNVTTLENSYPVDLTPPDIVFNRPAAGLVVTAGAATFTAHASDPTLADGTPGSGVDSVRFCFTPANPLQPVTCSLADPTAGGTWVTSEDLPSGVYDVNVSAQDLAGNSASASPSQVTVVNANT